MTTLTQAQTLLTNFTKRRDKAKHDLQRMEDLVAQQIRVVRKLTPKEHTA